MKGGRQRKNHISASFHTKKFKQNSLQRNKTRKEKK